MSKAAIAIEGFIANDLEVRNAGTHRVVEISVPHTPSKLVDGQWVNEDDKTVWFSATFWDEHADAVLSAVQKRSFVSITGGIELEVYAKRDGTPGGKVKISNPVIAAIVRRPKRGESVQSTAPAEEPWAASAPAGDVWSQPGSYSDETPF